jgi:hypothetical protein
MSSLYEFYIEKEKRELINTISSAKYISEEQKETMISVMLKEESPDEMKDDLRDLEDKLRDKKSYQNSQVGWKEDEYEALEKRIDAKRKAIKDAESSGRHTSS